VCTYEFLVKFIKKLQENPEFYKKYPELEKLVSKIGIEYFEKLCENGNSLSNNDIIKRAISVYKKDTQKFKNEYKKIKYSKLIKNIFQEGQTYGN